ncbi:MAG: flagellar biosynthetic protein FliO [Firmicutes bacterium]|nr:flagellar biosynthetic protein FliO [Bacillota bacterium]
MEEILTFLKLLGSLALVIVLAYCTLRYLLPYIQRGSLYRRSNMEVIERLPLAPRISLYLVRVGRRFFLLGMTPTTLKYLSEIAAEEIEIPEAAAADFAGILQAKKKKYFFGGMGDEKNEK